MCNIILSLMPGKFATFVELFGYHGDRKAGLDLLVRAGGWDVDQEEPTVGTGVCSILSLLAKIDALTWQFNSQRRLASLPL